VLTAVHEHQDLAAGFPIGKRFRSSEVMRVADASPRHLGHHHRADGRYRIYVFADRARIGEPGKVATLANWLLESNESPVRRFTPQDADLDSLFDVKVIYQQDYASMNINDAPKIFRPNVGELGLMDYEKVYAAWESSDIFEERQISREGAIIIVRPDMYVSHVLPLDSIQDLAGFFDDVLVPRI